MTMELQPAGDVGDAVVLVSGKRAVSYGPRALEYVENNQENITPVPRAEAEFWSVYIHDKEGFAAWVADVKTEFDAVELMPYLLMRWLGLNASMSGYTWIEAAALFDEATPVSSAESGS